jgi:lipopolysaccharide export system protein LptA
MRITGPEAVFEYGREQNLVKSVQVSGGVRVSDLEKWVTSQKVSVNFDKDRYVFSGNPRVVQNNDELQGEEIVFLEGGKKVEVFKARANVESREPEKAN